MATPPIRIVPTEETKRLLTRQRQIANTELPNVIQSVLDGVIQKIFQRSKELVPVRTGALRDSAVVESGIRGGMPTANITYGGGSVDYALKVHEDLDMQHPNGGQAKYLEQAFLDYETETVTAIQRAIMSLFYGNK